jgi:hypothetical protein
MPSLEWSDIDWGTVPTWIAGVFGGLSLVVALSIFLRDRINAERAQVDRVGALAKFGAYGGEPDGPPEAVTATAEITVQNASDLPVHVAQMAFVLRTTWAMAEADESGAVSAWTPVPGTDPFWDTFPPFDLAPQEVWTSEPEVNLSHLAPEGVAQLGLDDGGVTCEIAWLLIRDNAGRRWEVRPGITRRAKRIRWYSRPKEFQPLSWFSPLMRPFLVKRSKVRLTSDAGR